MNRTVRATPAMVLMALILLAPLAAAHAGGGAGVETRIDMPPWVAWVTGASVVVVSFAVVGAFAQRPLHRDAPAVDAAGVDALPRPVVTGGRALGLALLALTLLNGLLPGGGGAFPQAVVWVLTWALLPLAAYTLGNVWAVVSPFRALAPLADRLRGGRAPRAYPERLGVWPAVVLFVALIGWEVAAGAGDGAATTLARATLAYTVFTVAGMAVYGGNAWLARAEAFDRAFRWWSSFAPLRWTTRGPRLRSPTDALARRSAGTPSDVAFVIALLYGVNHDGFLATAVGNRVLTGAADTVGVTAAHALVLVAGYLVFLGAFWACVAAIRRVSESLESPTVLAGRFAASLIPIAVAYHLAHNLFYAVEAVPAAVAALGDPLGLGWNLLGTQADAFTIPAEWALALGSLQMLLIVAGHVLAVVVAHAQAFRGFPSRVQAIRSELPLTAVMAFYTLVGLWIVSQAGAHLPGGGA